MAAVKIQRCGCELEFWVPQQGVGSNPSPATNKASAFAGVFCFIEEKLNKQYWNKTDERGSLG